MPRGDRMPAGSVLLHIALAADEKGGKTSWALAAAEAGFNVLMFDGDVAGPRVAELSPEAKSRLYYMDVSDNLVGDGDPRMIQIVADFFATTRFLWNDTKGREYSRAKDEHDPETGAALDEIWEFRPSRLDHNWVMVIDSWTTLSYSAMLAKAQDLGVSIADVEKIERNLYSGVGNRLTNIAITQQKAPCHTIVIFHPAIYEKTRSPDGEVVRKIKEIDRIVEWSKTILKSSSNPHGFTLGKYFSDIGWIDTDKFGKRKIDFTKTSERMSGGNLNSKGDPRVDHRFVDVICQTGGFVPDGTQGTGEGLTIWEPGTYIPASAKPALALGAKKPDATPALEPKQPTQVQGLRGLMLAKPK